MASREVATVALWHQLLNDGRLEQLEALIDPEVEVGGPRGAGRGAALLRAWVGRAGVRLRPLRYLQKGTMVVVDQEAEWQAPGSGQGPGPQRVASLFTVSGGVITGIVRFPTLTAALEAAGMAGPSATGFDTGI